MVYGFSWTSFHTPSLLPQHQVYCRLHSKNSVSERRWKANFLAEIFFSTGTYGFTFCTNISPFTAISCMFYGERNGAVSRFYWLKPQKHSWPTKNAVSKVAPSGLRIPTCCYGSTHECFSQKWSSCEYSYAGPISLGDVPQKVRYAAVSLYCVGTSVFCTKGR